MKSWGFFFSSSGSPELERFDVNRILSPVGDHRGLDEFFSPEVNWTGFFASRLRSQIWVSYLSFFMLTSE